MPIVRSFVEISFWSLQLHGMTFGTKHISICETIILCAISMWKMSINLIRNSFECTYSNSFRNDRSVLKFQMDLSSCDTRIENDTRWLKPLSQNNGRYCHCIKSISICHCAHTHTERICSWCSYNILHSSSGKLLNWIRFVFLYNFVVLFIKNQWHFDLSKENENFYIIFNSSSLLPHIKLHWASVEWSMCLNAYMVCVCQHHIAGCFLFLLNFLYHNRAHNFIIHMHAF